jgi:mRNA-degrading endonuclease RelE of RelBE toxin-antitoxin system
MKPIELAFTKSAQKFLAKNADRCTKEQVQNLVTKALHRLQGKPENIDLERMKGKFQTFYRIRFGEIRILFRVEDGEIIITAIIQEIERRGNTSYS